MTQMQARTSKIVVALLAALLAAAYSNTSAAETRQAGSGLKRDSDGTPLIMKEDRPSRLDAVRKKKQRTVRIPRGSGGYVRPSVPVNVGAGVTTPPAAQVYRPPPITSFGDRATNAIHSYPLQKGIGNNPTDLPSYIRQNAN